MNRNMLRGLALGWVLLTGPAVADEAAAPEQAVEVALFAGGCFWCVEEAFDQVEGVLETTSGYAGGHLPNPSYEQVTAGGTGHAEVVRVRYDPDQVNYPELLQVFWRNVDPFDAGGQFCDRGESYRSGVFPLTEAQREHAIRSRQSLAERFEQPIATQIEPAATFYPAESYHQDYHQENPVRYRYYKWRCGRAERLQAIWN